MSAQASDESRCKRTFRVSLAGLLFIMLCACGFFAGYRRGYQTGGRDRRDSLYIVAYPVADLSRPWGGPPGAPPPPYRPDELIALLKSTVVPDSWKPRGDGELTWYDNNASLVVSQSEQGHEQMALALELLRAWRQQMKQLPIEVTERWLAK